MSVSISKFANKGESKKINLTPGTYQSVVKSIGFDENYVENSALRVTYELTRTDGTTVEFSEIFANTDRNERSAAFFDYLESCGIPLSDVEKFVGIRELLVLKKQIGKSHLTIEKRSLIDD